jgi:hypothetical protein
MSVRIFGDGLDALILAATLSKSKTEYSWYQSSEHIGGYFKGAIGCQGQPIDLGMVLLEPNDYDLGGIGIDKYTGESGVNARPFLSDAYSFLEETFGDLKSVEILMLDEKFLEFPDYFIADNLDVFSTMAEVTKLELLDKSNWILANPSWHPREKYSSTDQFTNIGLEEYLILIHGQHFYNDYFRSFMTNLLGTKKNRLSANLHRKAWMPIYWPETIINACEGAQIPAALFNPTFTRPNQGSVARWVSSMLKEVSSDESASVIKTPSIASADFDDFSSEYDFPFISIDKIGPSVGEKVLPIIEKVTLRMVHFCARNQKDSVFFLNNEHEMCFRYSTYADQDSNTGSVMFEFGDCSKEIPENDIIAGARLLAKKRGIELTCEGRVFNGSLPLEQINSQTQSSDFLRIPNQYSFQTPGNVTINDNIIRGAYAANKFERFIR